MTFDGEISSAYRFTANITLLGEMNNKCFSLKPSLQILVAVHCGSFTITLIMILPSTTLLFYFFLRSSIRETKAFRIILEEGRKKKVLL